MTGQCGLYMLAVLPGRAPPGSEPLTELEEGNSPPFAHLYLPSFHRIAVDRAALRGVSLPSSVHVFSPGVSSLRTQAVSVLKRRAYAEQEERKGEKAS